ncbi:MAG: MFS transporter [Cytophagales bacterium]|nr:MFS transporter [Cytophagales bacterium]
MDHKKFILPVIVFSQFCCTSLWFAGNSVINELISQYGLQASALSHLTSAVQLGFIIGTLVFALFTIADRFSPFKVFFFSALAGAMLNAGILFPSQNLLSLLSFRFLTGFFLAGIYPVGMKIATDYYADGLGKSLGFLVGALVLGTAFPYLLKGSAFLIPWKWVIVATSVMAFSGGTLILSLVPDGPFRKQGKGLAISSAFSVFKNRGLRAAAFGYFGHMWELYAFWAFLPIVLKAYAEMHPTSVFSVPFVTFFIIAIGGAGCMLAGLAAHRFGSKKIAFIALLFSGLCCLLSPILLNFHSFSILLAFFLFWGFTVTADSPLFSTLVANNASAEMKGTALTIVNCIGFAITIVSIQLLGFLSNVMNSQYLFLILGIGPILGLLALLKIKPLREY